VNKNALVIKGLGQTYDKPLFANVDMIIEAGDRVGITGQNGVGKTTLLKLLNGNEDASSGTIKWSDNAKIGYYAQDHAADFAEDMSLIDWMSQWRQDGQDIQEVRGILGKMLFKKDDINKRVKSLSGGEKGRMLFGKLMLQKNNVLLMDEPTNHLDMESIEGLNLALANYDGTLIFVSHDREFLSSLATKMISIENGQLDYYQGNYNDFETSKK
jgi:ATPase subunit of ABC transporter with duplicated ATPase domains